MHTHIYIYSYIVCFIIKKEWSILVIYLSFYRIIESESVVLGDQILVWWSDTQETHSHLVVLTAFMQLELYIYIYILLNPFIQAGCDTKNSKNLIGWIQSFPSPIPVFIARLKDPVYPTIYLKLKREQ